MIGHAIASAIATSPAFGNFDIISSLRKVDARKRPCLGYGFNYLSERLFLILRQLPGETEGASFSVRCHPKGRVCFAEHAIALRNRLEHLDELG